MDRRTRTLIAVAVAGVTALGACADGGPPTDGRRPYAVQDSRDIAALSPQRMADLLAGEGAGYALAAELNRYPGPRHVLDLAEELALSGGQRRRVTDIRAEMRDDAVRLGRHLVALEGRLDDSFESGAATADRIAQLTAAISEVEGRLRAVHLVAHVATRAVLTEHQIAIYDQLRGYSSEHQHGWHGS